MPGLDPNVILAAGQGVPTFNPLQTLTGVQALQNAQAENQLLRNQNTQFQQTQAAGAGLARLNAQNTNADGSVNANGLLAGVAQMDPNNPASVAALQKAQEIQQQQLANQLASQNLSQQQVQTTQKHLELQGQILAPIAANPNATMDDVFKAISDGSAHPDNGDPSFATNALSEVTNALPPNATSQQIQAFAKQRVLQGAGIQAALSAAYPQASLDNTGGSQHVVVSQPYAPGGPTITDESNPAAAPNAPIKMTATPEAMMGRTSVINPQTNTATSVANSALYNPDGSAKPGTQALQAGLAPGVAESATTGAVQSTQAYQQAQADAGAPAVQRLNALKSALTGIQHTNTGPGTAELNNVKSFIVANAPAMAAVIPGFNPSSVTNYDLANKYMTQYAAGAASSYGPGTDAKLATAASGNASAHINNLAAQDVLKVNIGLERAKQAAVQAFQQSGQPASNFTTFSSNFARTNDPRAFMLDQLSKQDRNALLNSLSPSEKTKFLTSAQQAMQLGAFSPADLPK